VLTGLSHILVSGCLVVISLVLGCLSVLLLAGVVSISCILALIVVVLHLFFEEVVVIIFQEAVKVVTGVCVGVEHLVCVAVNVVNRLITSAVVGGVLVSNPVCLSRGSSCS